MRAAATLIERDGLAAATIRDIAELAEVSPATVYNLIGSRDDVFDALFDDLVGQVGVDVGVLGDKPGAVEPLDGLLRLAASAAAFLIDGAALFRPLMAERTVAAALRDGPRLEWARRECARQLRVGVDIGSVDATLDLDRVGCLLVDSFIANFVRWALDEIDDAGFARRSRLDADVILRAVVTDAGRRTLDSLVECAA